MPELTRQQVIDLVCAMVEKAAIPAAWLQPIEAINGGAEKRFHFSTGTINLHAYSPAKKHSGYASVTLFLYQQFSQQPSEIKRLRQEEPRLIALACEIEAALKDVKVVDEPGPPRREEAEEAGRRQFGCEPSDEIDVQPDSENQ